jgi:hypothetical protein
VTPLAVTYATIAVVGLVAVAFCVARLWASGDPRWGRDFLRACFANWASTVMLVDLLIAAVAVIVWTVSEARRLGMRWVVWLILQATTPIAFSFPLFLAFRERARSVPARPA